MTGWCGLMWAIFIIYNSIIYNSRKTIFKIKSQFCPEASGLELGFCFERISFIPMLVLRPQSNLLHLQYPRLV